MDDWGGDETGGDADHRPPSHKASANNNNSPHSSKRRLGFNVSDGEAEGKGSGGGDGKRRLGFKVTPSDGNDRDGGKPSRRVSGKPSRDDVSATSVLRARGFMGWLRWLWQRIRCGARVCHGMWDGSAMWLGWADQRS